MARSKAGKPGYKGNLPSSLVGKQGAFTTKLMILKGRKLEALEAKEDTTEIDKQIAEVEEGLQQITDMVDDAAKEAA
jgi:hypothetical protein